MNRKLSIFVLIAGMAASAIIIIFTVSVSANNRKTHNQQLADFPVTETEPLQIGYFLKEYEGEIAVFRGDSKTPFRKLGIYTNVMTDEDKEMLSTGIFAQNEQELSRLIEDYTS